MATGPSYDFGGTALQVVIRVNWLSSTVTGLCDRQWRCGREDILGAFDGTTSPEGLRASMSGWIQEVTTTSVDLEGLFFSKLSP